MKKSIKISVIIFAICFVCLFSFKSFCDDMFMFSAEDFAPVIFDDEPDEVHVKALNEQTYSICRLMEIKRKLKNENINSFKEEFYNFYINDRDDRAIYSSIYTVFVDCDDLSKEEIDVIIEMLQKICVYENADIVENTTFIQYNLKVQSELLYETNRPVQALKTNRLLEEHLEDMKTEYMERKNYENQ